jgi:hypothetical protein
LFMKGEINRGGINFQGKGVKKESVVQEKH